MVSFCLPCHFCGELSLGLAIHSDNYKILFVVTLRLGFTYSTPKVEAWGLINLTFSCGYHGNASIYGGEVGKGFVGCLSKAMWVLNSTSSSKRSLVVEAFIFKG